ncbi:MAG TPA: alpha/beta hydrolase [Puia sp.]|nr:alpha/beta hydrolase [Puia sp.]
MTPVYFISGIAADSRLFRHIQLPEGFKSIHLSWIAPRHKESLKEYALRLSGKINRDEPFILVGLSLGGIIATEISNCLSPTATILISSVPVSAHLPPYYHFARKLGLQKIIPPSFFKWTATTKRLFTKEASEDKIVLKRMIAETDPNFIKWAINAVMNWKNETIPNRLFHIHGTCDEVFPHQFTTPTHVIKGGHTLVMSHAMEVNQIIDQLLFSEPGHEK